MMNQVVVVGRLAEIKDKDDSIIITLASNRPFKNSEGIYETDFIDFILYGNVAENTKDLCKKGDIIGIKARIQTKEVSNIKITELIADKVTFLSTAKKEE